MLVVLENRCGASPPAVAASAGHLLQELTGGQSKRPDRGGASGQPHTACHLHLESSPGK